MSYTSQQSTIYQNMANYIQDSSNWSSGVSKFSNIIVGDPLYVLLNAVAVAVDTNAYAIYLARQAANISTATEDDLDNKAADYGVYRKSAEAASSPFLLKKFTPSVSSTPIVKGSLISTVPDSSGTVITFTTTDDATLPAGQTQVSVSATCQTLGTTGNLVANTPMLISSAIPGIDEVQLTVNITNGVAKESDTSLRARTLAAFASLATGTLDWYEQTPTVVAVNATIQIHLLSGYDATVVCEAVKTAQTNYIDGLGVGAGDLSYIYASQLTKVANLIDGVVNATTTFVDTPVSQYQLPQANTINVTTF